MIERWVSGVKRLEKGNGHPLHLRGGRLPIGAKNVSSLCPWRRLLGDLMASAA
jgi:hypothetical protein